MSEKNVSDPKYTLAEYVEQIYSKRKRYPKRYPWKL